MFKVKSSLSIKIKIKFVFIALFFVIMVVLGCEYYKVKQHLNDRKFNSSFLSQFDTNNSPQKANTFEKLQLYENSKYNYSIKFPKKFLIKKYDARSGRYENVLENNNIIGIYTQQSNPFENFFEIQVYELSDLNKTFKEIYEDNYLKNTTHFETSDFSELKQIFIKNNSAYEYIFTGSALNTINWSGVVKNGQYRIIFFQKDNFVYSFYFTNIDSFNKILSTFQFTD